MSPGAVSPDLEAHESLIEALCRSAFDEPGQLPDLLKYLWKYRHSPDHLSDDGIRQHFLKREKDAQATGAARTACTRLREALEHFYLYSAEGLCEPIQVSLSTAQLQELPENATKKAWEVPRVYRLQIGPNLHRLTGPDVFWHSHLLTTTVEEPANVIVYTEPLVFRETKQRFFIRHLDVNERVDEEKSDDFYINELCNKLRHLKLNPKNLVKTRAYVPAGEVLSKDSLHGWLARRAKEVRKIRGSKEPSTGFIREHLSRDISNSTDDKIKGCHLILLGSVRANWLIHDFDHRTAGWMPCRSEEDGIRIDDIRAEEQRHIRQRLTELVGGHMGEADFKKLIHASDRGGISLREDWRRLAFALVSREIGLHRDLVVTVVAGNQGRAIEGVCRDVLTDSKGFGRVLEKFSVSHLPQAFQMVFAVALTNQESRPGDWKALLYRNVENARNRPTALKGVGKSLTSQAKA